MRNRSLGLEEKMKVELRRAIERYKQDILELGYSLFQTPELGFKEARTGQLITEFLVKNCMHAETGLSVTGIKSSLGESGVNICLIAEMDAVPTLGHPVASEDHSAAHACGHSNQVAIMLGVMKALKETDLLAKTGGQVTLVCTPAEEYTDLSFRRSLKETGQIKYLSGKQDMISQGVFDDVDLVISCHSMGGQPGRLADFNASLNGFLAKEVTYIGQAAHAGAQPHLGINALNAATIGLSAVNAQRETFLDEHNVRVHGIIKEGGTTVNTIPERVVLEVMVRGNSLEAIMDANKKVNRAFEAGAYAVGGKCKIEDTIGYLPFHQCEDLSAVIKDNMGQLINSENIIDGFKSMASGDIGDLGTIKPTIQFGFSGFSGRIHGSDFKIVDEEMAYIIPAQAIAMTVYDLLKDNGKKAKDIMVNNPPKADKETYMHQWLNKETLGSDFK